MLMSAQIRILICFFFTDCPNLRKNMQEFATWSVQNVTTQQVITWAVALVGIIIQPAAMLVIVKLGLSFSKLNVHLNVGLGDQMMVVRFRVIGKHVLVLNVRDQIFGVLQTALVAEQNFMQLHIILG